MAGETLKTDSLDFIFDQILKDTRRLESVEALVREIVATFKIERNREAILSGRKDALESLLSVMDRYANRYESLARR